jgi:hypothetical protein
MHKKNMKIIKNMRTKGRSRRNGNKEGETLRLMKMIFFFFYECIKLEREEFQSNNCGRLIDKTIKI